MTKKWWDAEGKEDTLLDNEKILEVIKKEYVEETCVHEKDAYINCISCVMNFLIEKIESQKDV